LLIVVWYALSWRTLMFIKPPASRIELVHPTDMIVIKDKHGFNKLCRFVQDGLSNLGVDIRTGRIKEATGRALGGNSAAHLLTLIPVLAHGGDLIDELERQLGKLNFPEHYDRMHDFFTLFSLGYEFGEAALGIRYNTGVIQWINENIPRTSISDKDSLIKAFTDATAEIGLEELREFNKTLSSDEDWSGGLITLPEKDADIQMTSALSAMIYLYFDVSTFDLKEEDKLSNVILTEAFLNHNNL